MEFLDELNDEDYELEYEETEWVEEDEVFIDSEGEDEASTNLDIPSAF